MALPSCRQMLEIAEEAKHLAAERSREPAGVLRVTASGSFADAQLTAALVDFQQQYPQVEIVLLVGTRRQVWWETEWIWPCASPTRWTLR